MIQRSMVLIPALALSFAALGCAAPQSSAPEAARPVGSSQAGPHRTPEQRRVYRLDFTLATSEPGKPSGSSAHTMNVEEDAMGEIRLGSNVVLGSGARQDVGLLLRCHVTPAGDDLLLEVTVEMSSADDAPNIRKLTTRGNAVVSPGKPALVASAEDPVTHKRFDTSVTATRLR